MNKEFKNLLDEIMSLPLQERPKIYSRVNTIPTKVLLSDFSDNIKHLNDVHQLSHILPLYNKTHIIKGVKGTQRKSVDSEDKNKRVNIHIPKNELDIIQSVYGQQLWSELGSSYCIRLLLKIAVETINEKNNVK